jgi:carbamoyl-phosphate synthase large subunit
MKDKRIFVSGGAGVIGLEMIPLLLERGATVFVGDLKPRPTSFPMEVRYRQGDLNRLTLGELEGFAPDVFIHLAATFVRSTETYEFWEENFWHNVRLSHHLMTVARNLPSLYRVVFSSSYLIYDPVLYQFDAPQSKAISLRETDSVRPRNLTGMAKLAHEIELRFLDGFPSTSFKTVCARIYRGYGRNSRDVISRWVRALLAGKPISVYRPEGLFDYIYARDSAEGLIHLAETDSVTGIINLGTGRARRVQEIIDILRKHFPNLKANIEASDIRFEASQADMSTYRTAVGWTPEFDLERAIPEIIAHEEAKRDKKLEVQQKFGHVLVTSASKKVPLIRAVQAAARKLHPDIKVIAGDLDENALTRHVADGFWKMPRTVDTEVDAMVEGCKQRCICTIIPTRDGELMYWARYQARFAEENIHVVVAEPNSIEVCLDKLAFAHFGPTNGLPFIPAGKHPNEIGEGPYVVKEQYGAGTRKVGLNLDRETALEHGRMLEAPIYQPFIVGQEISIDAWLDRFCRVKGVVLRTRDHVIDGESQVTTTFRDSEIEAVAIHVLQALKLRGPVVLQALIDGNKGLHVIECNTRFGGASTTSIEAGLDIFYWSLLESLGIDVSEYPFDRVAGEVRQIRVPNDIYVPGNRF